MYLGTTAVYILYTNSMYLAGDKCHVLRVVPILDIQVF